MNATHDNDGSDDSESPKFIRYLGPRLSLPEMRRRALNLRNELAQRRSVRKFASTPVPRELIELAIETASSAPSGAHRQPWQFVAISDPELKRTIRTEVEAEERKTYADRMPEQWRAALEPMGTDWHKPYLETAPWLIVVFEELYGIDEQGQQVKHYYVKESVGIACGFLIAALHQMGLSTLAHTPSPMGFLSKLLARPKRERAFVLLPVGFPAEDAKVPDLQRKPLDLVSTWLE